MKIDHHFEKLPGKVLIIDDDRSISTPLSKLLEHHSMDVRIADDGESGIKVLEEDTGISAVLLDLMMPGISGIEVLRRIRSNPKTLRLPVVVLTGKESSEVCTEAFDEGASDYITKPFNHDELLARLRAVTREAVLLKELEKRVQELYEVATIKDNLLNIASHDLRSPLTNIKGYADLLLQGGFGDLDTEQTDAVTIIQKNSNHILNVLSKLLDITRIDSNRFSLSITKADVCNILHQSLEEFKCDAEEKGIIIKPVSTDKVIARCDTQRILSACGNLISNAIKYCGCDDTIEISVTKNCEMVRVTVTDSGPGIPEDEHGEVFKRFAKISVRPTGKEKNVGLGLALVKEISQLHEGDAGFTSIQGEGSTFWFEIPEDGPVVKDEE